MPLIKQAKTPAQAAAVAQPAPVQAETQKAVASSVSSSFNRASALSKLDTKDRKILLQGNYQAALHSVGAVQHGGGTMEAYLVRVEEAANAGVDYVLRNI